MDNFIEIVTVQKLHRAPRSRAVRQVVPWEMMSNESLKFALDTLELHQSPNVYDALFEIQKRIAAGTWLDMEKPPPPSHDLPWWLQLWPFRLFWKQRT